MKKAKVKYIKRKSRKYAYGTGYQGIANYMETPNGELTQNQINIAKAKENAATNPWVMGLNVTADLVGKYGAKALGALQKDDPNMGNNADMASNLLGTAGNISGSNTEGIDLSGFTAENNQMANGGKIGMSKVEVENKEVGEMPNGQMLEFKGNTHENGGINVNLPGGTEIFSERIKVMGQSMSKRKKDREKRLLKIQTKLDENPTDAILKSTFEKVKADNEIADANDMQIQTMIDTLQKGAEGEFALGGVLGEEGIDNIDPTELTLSGQKIDGTSIMPENLQGKYVHYAPTTSLNPQDDYHRTLGDLFKNFLTTEQGRQKRVQEGKDALVTVEFKNGGKISNYPNGGITEGEPDPNAPIKTYEGADTWEDYQKYQSQLDLYNTYNTENTKITEGLGEGATIDPKKFNSLPGMQDFELPEGATGVKAYKGYSDSGIEVSPTLKGNYYTDEKSDTLYVPTYQKPEGNYEIIEDPAVTAENQRAEAWQEETKNIQGYVRNTYYDPECNCNRTEEVPLPVGQEIPTNGTFVPKSAKPPADWIPKTTPQMANGGTTGNLPIDPNDFMGLLNMISSNQTLGTDIQSLIDLNRTDAPISGADVNPYLQSDNSVDLPTTINKEKEGPFSNLEPGHFPGKWDEYQKWKQYKEKGIDPTKINADGTYGDTGLKLMDDTIEGDFMLDSITKGSDNTEASQEDTIQEKNLLEKIGNLGITPGDLIGLTGNTISTFAPLLNTLKSRSTDTPNINAFTEYGKEGIKKVEDAIQFADDTKAANLQALEEKTSSQRKRNRNTARGVNTMRALDLQTEANANLAENQVHNNFAGLMSQLLSIEAQFLNQQDQVVMGGEQAKDLADRQDKDVFYTNLGSDLSNIGLGLQETGKDINVVKQQEVMMNLLNQLSKYGITIDNSGNLGTNG